MAFLCSKNSKVKEQRTHTRSGASAQPSNAKSATRGRAAAPPGPSGKRSVSAPLTVTEQHKYELRQRRLRELENYPYGKKNSSAPNSARGQKKESGGGLFARFRQKHRDSDEDATSSRRIQSPVPAGAPNADDVGSLASSYTIVVDDFTFDEPNENGDTQEVHLVSSPFDSRRARTTDCVVGCASSPLTTAASTRSSNTTMGPRSSMSVNSLTSLSTHATSGKNGVKGTECSTRRSALARTPPPAHIPEWQGYYMYDKVDEETHQRMWVRSNRPPRRSKSLEAMRPAPIRVPGH